MEIFIALFFLVEASFVIPLERLTPYSKLPFPPLLLSIDERFYTSKLTFLFDLKSRRLFFIGEFFNADNGSGLIVLF